MVSALISSTTTNAIALPASPEKIAKSTLMSANLSLA
jgi:hypothetical protein